MKKESIYRFPNGSVRWARTSRSKKYGSDVYSLVSPPKGLPAKTKDVHTELVQALGSDAIPYSTVTKNIRNTVILQDEPEAEDRAEDQGFSITDNAILKALKMIPFASIRQIAKMTFIPLTVVCRRWTKSLHFLLKRLHWVPYRLSDLQNQAPVSSQSRYWSCLIPWDIIRGRISWFSTRPGSIFWSFDISTDYESIWLSPEDEAP
jgi:hypothetical protein